MVKHAAYDTSVFFSDFAVAGILLDTNLAKGLRGILKSPPVMLVFEEAQWTGRAYTWIVSETDIEGVNVGQKLRIENHDYQILQIMPDGTGLAYLTLERITPWKSNLIRDS